MMTARHFVRSSVKRSKTALIHVFKDDKQLHLPHVRTHEHSQATHPRQSVQLLWSSRLVCSWLVCLLALLVAVPASAQPPIKKKGFDLGPLEGLDIETVGPPGSGPPGSGSPSTLPGKGGLPGASSFPSGLPGGKQTEPIAYSAEYTLSEDGKSGELRVTASLSASWHTYSVTQPPGGPKQTVITVDEAVVRLTGPIISDQPPEPRQYEVYPGVPVEEHAERVVWKVPFTVVADLKSTPLKVSIDALICADPPLGECRPINETITARPITAASNQQLAAFRPERSHVEVSAHVTPAEVKPGGEATVVIKFKLDDPFHIYTYTSTNTEAANKTLIVPINKGGMQWGMPFTDAKVHTQEVLDMKIEYYEKEATWRIPVRVPESTSEGHHDIAVAVGFQTCTESMCDAPSGIVAKGSINVVAAPGSAEMSPLAIEQSESSFVADQPNLASWIDFQPTTKEKVDVKETARLAAGNLEVGTLSLATILSALAGGFILNFMPCVLPSSA